MLAGLLLVSTGLVSLSATSASASSTTLNIGLICTCTGPLSSSGEVGPPAFEAWADAVNAAGGLNGHKLKVFYKNDASNVITAQSDVESMINQDKIQMLVDDSAVDTNFAKYVDNHKVPVIGGSAESGLELTDPNFFTPGQTVDAYNIAFALAAKKVGVSVLGQFYCAESTVCTQGVGPFRSTAAAEGLKVTYTGQVSYSAPNYTPQCLAAQQAGVTMLDVADAPTVVTTVAMNCTAQGYTPWYVGADGAVSTSFLTTPGLSSKFIGVEPDVPFFANTPGVKKMTAIFKKYADKQTLESPNYSEESVEGYVSGLILAEAVKNANVGSSDPITSADIYKGLYMMHKDTLNGMAPPLTFVKGKPNPSHCFFWIRIQNGKFTTPYGNQATCAKVQS
jgi:branched-chain amino acid transport system substrate-binding protein